MSDIEALTSQVYLIYDEYRNMALNRKYYGVRLEKFKRYNTVMESVIAIGATGSGVAGFAVFQTNYGTPAWALISAASILLAIVKPFLKFGDRIENYGKLFGGYARAYQSMKILVGDLQVRRTISEEDHKAFIQIRNRIGELADLEDTNPNAGFVRALQQEVNAEISIDRLWIPHGYAIAASEA